MGAVQPTLAAEASWRNQLVYGGIVHSLGRVEAET